MVGKIVNLRIDPPMLLWKEDAFLRALFSPAYYAGQARLAAAMPEGALFDHFLAIGLAQGLSPSPLFQGEIFDALDATGPDPDGLEPAVLRWLTLPAHRDTVPTSRFDAEWYLETYPEVRAAGIPPFRHFIAHGLGEGRGPNAVFDTQWYQNTYPRDKAEAGLPAYLHYLIFGLERGCAPRQLLLPVFAHQASGRPSKLSRFDAVEKAARPWIKSIGEAKFTILLALFLSYAYDGEGELRDDADGVARLVHFLENGLMRGFDPGPFFNSAFYLGQLESEGRSLDDAGVPLLHFLHEGALARTMPNEIFDPSAYASAYPDVEAALMWGFEHFILHGIFEGRGTDGKPHLAVSLKASNAAETDLNHWRAYWALHDARVRHSSLPRNFGALEVRLQSVLASDAFDEIVVRARTLEPALGDVKAVAHLLGPPAHDLMNDLRLQARARIPRSRYDSIVCIPWLRMGGADLVACQLAEALQAIRPGEHVLLLRTDRPNFERPDWIPAGIDVADVSDLLNSVPHEIAERVLRSVFAGLAPKRILNVNSHAAWRTIARFGSRLSAQSHLYAYLFCWDQTPGGVRFGYPTEFFASASPCLAATFTDTDYLRNELIKLYHLPRAMRDRTVALYSPARVQPPGTVFAATAAAARGDRRPKVLWAGRLDRQKRFDLVQETARLLPHVDFVCWGAALLDAPPDMAGSPANLRLNAPYGSIDELPLQDADLWLFTSAWEGMPTILIELAIRGMSVAGSMVGGVPELLDEATGYPVFAISDPAAYARAIEMALDNPQERVIRARRLQRRAARRHDKTAYFERLRSILGKEG